MIQEDLPCGYGHSSNPGTKATKVAILSEEFQKWDSPAVQPVHVHSTRPDHFSPLRKSSLPCTSSPADSSSTFQSILDAALCDYAKQTGVDLATHPSAQILQNCNSADAILDILGEKAKQFQAYGDGNRKLIGCLKPVVQVLHLVSGILGVAATMVSSAN